MTPTTPPTTREARILAGREALLRLSPDRNRVQRGPSASSTASSIASTVSSTAMHDITEEAAGIAEVAHQVIRPSSHAKHIPAENLVFPDKSLRPIPLKAYRVRKMTLKERNDAYTEAVQEFTRARTGLGVWALRSMMQHRPTTMQDPPVIVRAIAGKYGPGQAPTIQQHRQDTLSKGQLGAAKAATGEPLPGTVSSISGNVSGGIGTRIKNADDTVTTGGVPVYHDSTGGIGPITSSGFMERPMKRSLSNHSSRRPMSMMIIPNRDQSAGSRASGSVGRTGSAGALSSQSSSSLGSISSGSITSTSRTAHEHEGQQQEQKQRVLGVSNRNLAETEAKSLVYNEDGVLIPYADETTSKDEVYSPLTSPIMIPIGGFQGYSRVTGTGVGSGGRSSPQSAEGGGLTRPSTFASASSPLTTFSNPLSILSPTSPSSFSGTGPSPMPQRTIHPSLPTPEGGLVTIGSVKDRKEKATASQRHSTSSFSSLASFAKYQKRDSFVAGTTSKRMSKRERKKEEEQQRLDQRYSVSSASLNHQALLGSSSKSDYVTEQSLDKLSDVLPHVDRDRLSIYLQRSFGDEMVAISLAMADLRNGLL
ncbi:hypothetical protein BGZ83_003311 [Gryganskiella cystojenkinii]|nr:hypothetical protein BGZ83_003311 [Gryganskiella cystojenkinii]